MLFFGIIGGLLRLPVEVLDFYGRVAVGQFHAQPLANGLAEDEQPGKAGHQRGALQDGRVDDASRGNDERRQQQGDGGEGADPEGDGRRTAHPPGHLLKFV